MVAAPPIATTTAAAMIGWLRAQSIQVSAVRGCCNLASMPLFTPYRRPTPCARRLTLRQLVVMIPADKPLWRNW